MAFKIVSAAPLAAFSVLLLSLFIGIGALLVNEYDKPSYHSGGILDSPTTASSLLPAGRPVEPVDDDCDGVDGVVPSECEEDDTP